LDWAARGSLTKTKTGRDRIEEFKQRNCLWYTDDVDLYYLGYRGTDDAADSWEFVLESDYKN